MSTTIKKCAKSKLYTKVSNSALQDSRLSFKARGLIAYILSLPDDWEIVLEHLYTVSPQGRESINSAMSELKVNGYMVLEKIRDAKTGYIVENRWTAFDDPSDAVAYTGFSTLPEPADSPEYPADLPDDGKPVRRLTRKTVNPEPGKPATTKEIEEIKEISERKEINPISVGSFPFPETQHGLSSGDLPENEVNQFADAEPKPTPQMIALALIDGQRLEEVADWDQYRYLVGKLRKVCPGLTVANIEERAEWYRKSNPKWPLTAKALVSHWGKLRDEWYESFGWMTMPPANKQPEGKA